MSDALKIQTCLNRFSYRILITAADKKLISVELFVDSTHVKANANKRRFEKKIVRKETRAIKDAFKMK